MHLIIVAIALISTIIHAIVAKNMMAERDVSDHFHQEALLKEQHIDEVRNAIESAQTQYTEAYGTFATSITLLQNSTLNANIDTTGFSIGSNGEVVYDSSGDTDYENILLQRNEDRNSLRRESSVATGVKKVERSTSAKSARSDIL